VPLYEVIATMDFRYRIEAENEREARDAVEEGEVGRGELFAGPDIIEVKELRSGL
jgi:hypothetical protein